MIVMKFGGTSLSNLDRMQRVVALIERTRHRQAVGAVVCSAMAGVTDRLIEVADLMQQRRKASEDALQALRQTHEAVLGGIHGDGHDQAQHAIEGLFKKLEEVLQGIYLVRECSPQTLDYILSFGERCSSILVTHLLAQVGVPCRWVDARELIMTDDHFGCAKVKEKETLEAIAKRWGCGDEVKVLPGFVGFGPRGRTTTLGRGGSDLTASWLGAALKVEEIQIWTDVDGVMTADPRIVPQAISLESISYEEAMELSHFGAKVIYPPTMAPALKAGIPLRIKNTLNPDHAGTRVGALTGDRNHSVTGLTATAEVSLLQLKGCGMIGASGVAARLFAALAQAGINVIFISQASSEHSICVAVDHSFGILAQSVVSEAFAPEIRRGQIDPVQMEPQQTLVAVVGEGMRHTPGIAGQVFSALGAAQINVAAIAQGSSELNINCVVPYADREKALRQLHRSFFREPLSVVLLGPGLVGQAFLSLLDKPMAGLKLLGVAKREGIHWSASGILPESFSRSPFIPGTANDLHERLMEHIAPLVVVDATGSESFLSYYDSWLQRGFAVVTPNKQAMSGPMSQFEALSSFRHFYYEANVCAGLPVIAAVRDLTAARDKIHSLQAVLSGSISAVLIKWQEGLSFSEAVAWAQRAGFCEPHPLDDLNGLDVARKLLILARTAGFTGELPEVRVEPLVQEELRQGLDARQFMEALPRFDALWERRRPKKGEGSWVFLAQGRRISRHDFKMEATLRQVEANHPAATLKPGENWLAIHSQFYCDQPLSFRGPGAGARVTAARLLSDLMHYVQDVRKGPQ